MAGIRPNDLDSVVYLTKKLRQLKLISLKEFFFDMLSAQVLTAKKDNGGLRSLEQILIN